MPDIQKDNTAVKQPLKPDEYPDIIGPPAPRNMDTGYITTDYSNPFQRAAQRWSSAYINSDFAKSPFMDVMRWIPGLNYVEKVVTAQPVSEEESMSFVLPMKVRKVPTKRVNLDNYIDELEDAGIFFEQNKPAPKKYKDPILDTYREGRDILNEKGKEMPVNQVWTNKKALDMHINNKIDWEVNPYFNKKTRNKIWNNYVSSMDRRRHDYFYGGMNIGNYPDNVYIDMEANAPSAIFGFENNGIFTASHFAPSDLKSGYRMLSNLVNEPRPVLFSVPDDLASQLSKLGYTKVGEGVQPFGSELVKKNYLINNGFTLEGLPDYYRDFLKDVPLFEYNGKHYFTNTPAVFKDGSEKIKYIIK